MKNELFELGRRRRSVRKYGDAPVSDDIICEILKTGLTAPSSFGHRPVEYVVVRNPASIRNLSVCKRMGGKQICSADTVIVVIVKTADKRSSEFWIEDGAIASSYFLLAAEQYGLGACWVHIRNRTGQIASSDEEIRDLLGIPDGYTVLNLVAIGEKAEFKAPYDESELPFEKIHREKF